jgi:hypothetical protein
MKHKMKFIISLALLVSMSFFGYSQQVTASGGGHYESDSHQFYATIGESVIITVSGDYILTQGFQQSKYTITGIYSYKSFDKTFSIYPNPLKDNLMISINDDLRQYEIIVLNELGEKLITEKMQIGRTPNAINFSEHKPGIYLVRIIQDKDLVLKTYKVVKL